MADLLRSELKARDAFVKGDNAFQRRARLLQCLWRESVGLDPGSRNGKPKGARLSSATQPRSDAGPDDDPDRLANFLTDTISNVARLELAEVGDPETDRRWSTDRVRLELIASQPMLINLFGELIVDPVVLTAVLSQLWAPAESTTSVGGPKEGIAEVTAVELRRPATIVPGVVDVLVEFRGHDGNDSLLGFRVRYAENFRVGAVDPDPAWDAVATGPDELAAPPLQQVWLDYLALREVATELGVPAERTWFVQLHPAENFRAADVAGRFLDVVNVVGLDDRCEVVSLERFVESVSEVVADDWVGEFAERYLGFVLVDELLGFATPDDGFAESEIKDDANHDDPEW